MRGLPTAVSPNINGRAEGRNRGRLVGPPRYRLVKQERYLVRDAQGLHVLEGNLGPMAALCVLLADSFECEGDVNDAGLRKCDQGIVGVVLTIENWIVVAELALDPDKFIRYTHVSFSVLFE